MILAAKKVLAACIYFKAVHKDDLVFRRILVQRLFSLISSMSTIKVDPPHSSQNHAAVTLLCQQRFLKYHVKDTNVFFSFFLTAV